MANVVRAARNLLSVPVCVVALSVAGALFVGDPTGAALAPFFVAAPSAALTVALLVAYLVARRRS